MAFSGVLVALLLQVAAAAAGFWGLGRIQGLRSFQDDGRLRRLAWFFGLLATAMLVQAVVTVSILRGRGTTGTRLSGLAELAYHVVFVAALVVSTRFFAGRDDGHPAVAAAMVGLLGPFGLVGLVEAALALYLAVASFANQRRRHSSGSLRVAWGFLLVFAAQAAFWVFARLHEARPFWGEAVVAAGVLLLVSSLPRAHLGGS